MKKLNDILSEIGISKVKLAKYLGVSRQMVYNYLEMDDVNAWPLEKKMKLFNLLQVKSADDIENIEVNNDFIKHANNLINENDTLVEKGSINFSGLKNSDQELLNDIIFILKEKLEEDDSGESAVICKYLCYFLQAMDNIPEIKYMLGYIAKTTGFVNVDEYVFEKNNQFTFETILYSAMVLYTSGSASESKIQELHKKFASDINKKQEEKLSRTQEINSAKIQALKELGYTEINESNYPEVVEKMAEIQSRKI